jgi:hypothetical protein
VGPYWSYALLVIQNFKKSKLDSNFQPLGRFLNLNLIFMLFYAVSCCFMQFHAVSCSFMQFHAVSCSYMQHENVRVMFFMFFMQFHVRVM